MFGLGTIINTGAIVLGGILGLVIGRFLKEKIQKIVTVAMGLSTLAISLGGIVSKMIVISESLSDTFSISTKGTFVIIFSLLFGGIIGEVLDIDLRLENFGIWLKKKFGSEKDGMFVEGFVIASLTVCVGAMAVVGSIMDGLEGDYSILLAKSIMDFVIIIALTASKGRGVIFSAIPVFVLQGSITVLAKLIAPVLNEKSINNLSLVGSLLILCVAVNILADGKFRIKVANLLPALIIAVICAFIPFKLLSM